MERQHLTVVCFICCCVLCSFRVRAEKLRLSLVALLDPGVQQANGVQLDLDYLLR